ncbi:Gon7 family protein [Apiospora arundinis]|uniref:EKC/KEOPS complex subunit GON7 n=1 Tax=Apiospora arundinis TaxID=335852 RepID=A0ABR2IIQ0_9PEZI
MPTLTSHSEAPHSDPFTFTTDLSLPDSTTDATLSTTDKSAYLARLRAAVSDHQARVNEALTARMEADKIRDPSSAPSATTEPTSNKNKKRKKNNGTDTPTTKTAIADEDAEEQNYGEEVVDEDDEV